MRQINASEARSRFGQLLDEVQKGESVVIARRGKRVARLNPDPEKRRAGIARAIREIRDLRPRFGRITVEEILSARDEGRKY